MKIEENGLGQRGAGPPWETIVAQPAIYPTTKGDGLKPRPTD
jgi:hypothetical protein